jgi:hypothetical protein
MSGIFMSLKTLPALLVVERRRSVLERGPRPDLVVQHRDECPSGNLPEHLIPMVVAPPQRHIRPLHQAILSRLKHHMGIKPLPTALQISLPSPLALQV